MWGAGLRGDANSARGIGALSARALQVLLPHAETVALEHSGHWPHEEEPARVIAAIERFLQTLESSGHSMRTSSVRTSFDETGPSTSLMRGRNERSTSTGDLAGIIAPTLFVGVFIMLEG